MSAPNSLHIVQGGDHSLVVRKKDLGNQTQDDVEQGIANAIRDFLTQD